MLWELPNQKHHQDLHNAGIVFYRPGLFDDRIILDQAWALEAIYAVFNRENCYRPLLRLRGRFTRAILEARRRASPIASFPMRFESPVLKGAGIET